MEPRLTGNLDVSPEVKRFNCPDTYIETECPECGEPKKTETVDILEYPVFNEPGVERIYCCCYECDHEWSIPITLHLSIEIEEEA